MVNPEVVNFQYLDTFIYDAIDLNGNVDEDKLKEHLLKYPIFDAESDSKESVFSLILGVLNEYYMRLPIFENLRSVKPGSEMYFANSMNKVVLSIEYKSSHGAIVNTNAGSPSYPLFTPFSEDDLVKLPKTSTYVDEFYEQMKWSTQRYAKLILEIPDKNGFTDEELELKVRRDILKRYQALKDEGLIDE